MTNFKNIVLHWTAGNYFPCETDLKSYHYVIDKDGKIYRGKYFPEDNLNCKDGKYAPHCGGGNTGRIGIAICCRKDVKTPPVRKQVEAMCNLAAQLCECYNLKPSDCITHAEFTTKKIDINSLPYEKLSGVKPVADYLRNKIQWYHKQWLGQ